MISIRAGAKLAAVLAVALAAMPAAAQYLDDAPPPPAAAPTSGERPADALARNVRILAQTPRDYNALVGAGRAALLTGDPEAAVGFFGRAADVSPEAAAPHAGLGAALASMGEARDAMPEFDKAVKAGGSVVSFALDRGLAHDLLGQQAAAQADYRLALSGPNAAEARRRLALSQAIAGSNAMAMQTLSPLLQHSDVATNRVRAFILALGGNATAADQALDNSVPGLSRSLDPFFRRLPGLNPAQKAAAVHLGIMPGNGTASTVADANATGDRLAEIEALLRPAPAVPPVVPPRAAQQTQMATTLTVRPATSAASAPRPTAAAPAPRRIWIQLATGDDETALARQFSRISSRDRDIFDGIQPYVSVVDGRSKLLIGPFRSNQDSETFLENLADVRIDGSSWISAEGQIVRKLANP